MKNDTVVCARIDKVTKEQAMKVLQAMGLSMSDAIRLLLVRVANEKRMPFSIQVPSSATTNAINELNNDKGKRFKDAGELFCDLNL